LLRAFDTILKLAGWERVASQIGAVIVEAAGKSAGTMYNSGVTAFVNPDDKDALAALRALGLAITSEGIPCAIHFAEQLIGKTPMAIAINVGKKRYVTSL